MSSASSSSIEGKNLSLSFPLYQNNDPNAKSKFINLFKKKDPNLNKIDYIHAINDIDFSFKTGECIGLIGDNGAGKSTLIRLISKIYSPTNGSLLINGKVTTLMDFGIGFNEELNAIENIKIASLIMGIPKIEIKDRTKEILEFSELQEFANLPLKYYSKGMRARLGFTTATEINPEILLLDEVFSGGDIHWLEKSTSRLEKVIEQSHIVIIVSHTLNRILKYCNRSIWLKKGKIVMDDSPENVIEEYKK